MHGLRAALLRRATTRAIWAVYGLMAVLLVAYLASLIFQGDGHQWPMFNDWVVAGFEGFGSLLCLLRAFMYRPGRAVALALGIGNLLWSIGDLVETFESRGGVEPPVPSLSDAFWLTFFPVTYIAVLLYVRGEIRKLSTPNWLDGVVAGVGAAAACAAFAFHSVLRVAGGGTAAVLTNLAYPVADLLLLGLVVGGSVFMTGRRKAPWILMATGMGINVIGDTSNLFMDSLGRVGFVLDGIAWPTSILCLSMSVWFRPRASDPRVAPKQANFVIPGLSTACALAVLLVGNLHAVSKVAVGLAGATLVLVGIRLVLSVRAMRLISQERHEQSVTDELTGLGNRRYLTTVLDAFFAEHDVTAEPRSLAVLFVDLDHFKEINDTYGHPAGDELLRQLGPRMSGCVRAGDVVTRLGGDEFVVLLLDRSAETAVEVATSLTKVLAEPFDLGRVRAEISASIGIAEAPVDATDATSLLWCADIAMYRAKVGGVPFVRFQQDLDETGNRLALLDELRTAIDEHQLVLEYQPQLDLRTGEVVAVEALLRWLHPTRGVIPPLDFLPFAEQAGLMGPITELVLVDSIRQCATWHSEGRPLTVSVNISASNLVDPGLPRLVRTLLDRHGVAADALVLEITETTVISDFEQCQRVTRELSDLGVLVSIDDFGAGFTSLAHLSGLAINELKLDRVFISGLSGDDSKRTLPLVRATIELGHSLGLRVVAEGIEDEATLALLSDLGCDLGQGYLIGKPTPAGLLALRPQPIVPASAARPGVKAA
jgi:diguanylate cyclase (GGDEF)-like protein